MNQETLTALQGSIAKWQRIVNNTGVDRGTENCPLCLLFYKDGCTGCPVMKKSGEPQCRNTPYEKYAQARYLNGTLLQYQNKIYTVSPHDMREMAKQELQFLQSLLP